MTTFHRNGLSLGRTAALLTFKQHQTEINRIYWAFVPGAHFLENFAAKGMPSIAPAKLFAYSGPDAARLAQGIPAWRADFVEACGWLRLSLLIAALGYFEVYLKSVAELSIRSDPGVLYGKPKHIEGVSWLKLGINPDISAQIEGLTKGTWDSRTARYKKLFETVPAIIIASSNHLDSLRKIRNGASHTFGRTLDYTFVGRGKRPSKLIQFSESDLKASLGLIGKVAHGIDHHLGKGFIGEYEALAFYHSWKDSPDSKLAGPKGKPRLLSKALGEHLGYTYGKDFCGQLIEFYSKA